MLSSCQEYARTVSACSTSSSLSIRSAWLRLLAVAALSLGAVACGEETAPSNTNSTPCESISDCDGTQTCDLVAKVCVARECDDAAGKTCGAGKICKSFKCTIGIGGQDATSGEDGTTTDATVNDTATGTDASGPKPTDKSCSACMEDSECGSGFDCVLLVSGTKHCAKKCTASSDCGGGYSCQDVESGAKHCVTPTYECTGCLVDGCPSGQECNVKTAKCIEPKNICDSCNLDTDCGNGSRCVKLGAGKICAPDCGAGQGCPANSQCVSLPAPGGGAVCAYNAKNCCYGEACTSNCTDCKTACVAGTCVACTEDSDCGAAKCNLSNYTCITEQQCPPAEDPDKKIFKKDTSECVECINDTHCASSSKGPKCDVATNTCGASTQVGECAVCGGAYPSCAQINGTWSCVECATDDECKAKGKGTCSATTYTCSGSTGGTGTGPATGTCKSDADCPADPNGTFTLMCDTSTGLCYDIDGKCDNVAAFCNAAQGSNCKLSGDLLGGIGGAIPGGGGTTPAGNVGQCTCPVGGTGGSGTPSIKPECSALAALLPNLKNCDCAADPNSANCKDLLGLGSCCTNATSGGGGGLPFDPACLAGLTGGTNTGVTSASCFGGIKCSQGLDCLFGAFGGGQSAPTWTCGTSSFAP